MRTLRETLKELEALGPWIRRSRKADSRQDEWCIGFPRPEVTFVAADGAALEPDDVLDRIEAALTKVLIQTP